MNNSTVLLREKLYKFYEDTEAMADAEERLANFLFSEVITDLRERNINSFHEWLNHFWEDSETFLNDIVKPVDSYYYKVLTKQWNEITIEEKIVMYNSLALYAIEMDIDDFPGKQIMGQVLQSFTEIIANFHLFKKGYLSLKGDILISDKSKCQFFTVWKAGEVEKTIPIILS